MKIAESPNLQYLNYQWGNHTIIYGNLCGIIACSRPITWEKTQS